MSQQALWSGRFEDKMDDSTLSFTSSLDVDVMLSFYDVMGSLAHVRMLKKCEIIPSDDADRIIEGLKTIAAEMENGEFKMDESLEDIHTNVEFRLTDMIGPAGGKLHTGRSRNDQVATDFRMYLRDMTLETVKNIDLLIDSLITIAKDNGDTVMPGFTHMQHAQPVTLAQHMLAHAFKLSRDAQRFLDAFERLNLCPLGSAALAGTTYPIDREMTARSLGFKGPTFNSMDSVSDRDFVTELAFCASLTSIHLSSMSEELVLWSSQEFGFIEMADKYTTGSSIMPQKKNPDIAELIRGRSGAINGSLITMLMMIKGLPLSYNRDLQEDKKPVMESLDSLNSCLTMMSKVISTMKVRSDVMLSKVTSGFINATDLADYLVTKGVPFREAHGIVGASVRYCIDNGKKLDDLSVEEFNKFSPLITDDVYQFIDVRNCVERRSSFGGTSSASTDYQLMIAIQEYMAREDIVRQESDLIESCWDELLN
ncbi:MAG: argininosuccinate lyase [Methanomassiliicoccales archaeon]|uniref:argininosuccinate lyase n=1 Tax=Candidatus Methanarcanum hacksteinii TaxID=2911857 RepID=UPI002A770719|nr:argininosuccinate lyase [Candidatus Methanomethylophilaceae archaeon]MCI6025648.1 argininosuccinate lyase [Methanomassiliicoccales archaeon]MDD7478506.1 argininosuccinate lyase [Methanomassiliicoccales archaeon]